MTCAHDSGPRFLALGPEKTGSSWLYRMLAKHPATYVTPKKEIGYFYERWTYPREGVFGRLLFKGDWHNAEYRAYLNERLKYFAKQPSKIFTERSRLFWDRRFLLGKRTDDWYLSLFWGSPDNLLPCDISPLNFHLPPQEIRRVRSLLPGAKALVVLREPTAWLWSFAQMSLIGDRPADSISEDEYVEFFKTYLLYYPCFRRLQEWKSAFGNDLKVGFFDDLEKNPLVFLDELCEFLSIEKFTLLRSIDLSVTPVNRGQGIPVPLELEYLLQGLCCGIVAELADELDGPFDTWLKSYRPYSRRS